jgi:hypothetical protein
MVLGELISYLLYTDACTLAWTGLALWFCWWLARPYCRDAAKWWDDHRPKCRPGRAWRSLKRKKGWGK